MAATLRDYQQIRVPAPPSTVTGDLAVWMRQVTDALNQLPAQSTISRVTPESLESGVRGAVVQNLNPTSVSRVWVKDSTDTTLNWGWPPLVLNSTLSASAVSASLGTTTINGALLFGPDNRYSLGSLGASRPFDAYISHALYVGPVVSVTDPVSGNALFKFVDSGTTWAFGGAAATFAIANGSVVAMMLPHATQGAVAGSFSNHPLTVRVNNTAVWQWTAAGHLTPIADATYDIGISTTSYPRHLYLRGGASLASATALPSTVSARGYFYTDSASSVWWVNGSGVSTLVA